MGDAKCERCGLPMFDDGAADDCRDSGGTACLERVVSRLTTENATLSGMIANAEKEHRRATQSYADLAREVATLRAKVPPPTAPVQLGYGRTRAPAGTPGSVPWAVHVRAWESYAARHGKDQSAARIAERGGFDWREMDEHFPGWRAACDFEQRAVAAEAEAAGLRARLDAATTRRPESEWHEDIGPVLWWNDPISEPAYCGTPLDDDFPDYMTRWTPLLVPAERSSREGAEAKA